MSKNANRSENREPVTSDIEMEYIEKYGNPRDGFKARIKEGKVTEEEKEALKRLRAVFSRAFWNDRYFQYMDDNFFTQGEKEVLSDYRKIRFEKKHIDPKKYTTKKDPSQEELLLLLQTQASEVVMNAQERFEDQYRDNADKLFADLEKYIKKIPLSDFKKTIEDRKEQLKDWEQAEDPFYYMTAYRALTEDNYHNFYLWLEAYTKPFDNAIGNLGLKRSRRNSIVENYAREMYGESILPSTRGGELFKYPPNHYKTLTKTTGLLFGRGYDELIKEGQLQVDITHGQKGTHLVYISLFNPDNIKGIDNISDFDKSVHDAVVSIIESGYDFFTARQVANHLFKGGKGHTSEKNIQLVKDSIEKMWKLHIGIDYSSHLEYNGLPSPENATREGAILPLVKDTLTINGQTVEGYKVIHIPPLYEYSKIVNQIMSVPSSLLSNIPLNMNKPRVLIREYLIQETGRMRSAKNKKWNDTITIEKLISVGGYKSPSRTERKRIIDTVITILESFKNDNWIKGYTENKIGKSLHSITIKV